MNDFKVGDLVYASITDTVLVKGVVDSFTETRIRVRLDTPVIIVERTVEYRIFRKNRVMERSFWVTLPSFGIGTGLVRVRHRK